MFLFLYRKERKHEMCSFFLLFCLSRYVIDLSFSMSFVFLHSFRRSRIHWKVGCTYTCLPTHVLNNCMHASIFLSFSLSLSLSCCGISFSFERTREQRKKGASKRKKKRRKALLFGLSFLLLSLSSSLPKRRRKSILIDSLSIEKQMEQQNQDRQIGRGRLQTDRQRQIKEIDRYIDRGGPKRQRDRQSKERLDRERA